MRAPPLVEQAQELEQHLRTIREVLRRPTEQAFASGNLTGPQRSTMQALVRAPGGLSLKQLSRTLGLAHSTVSGIVDRLQAKGLVRRETDPADRRSTRIVVSAPVTAFVSRRLPELTLGPVVESLRRATPAERMAVMEGVRTLRRLVTPTPRR